jgi:hypothetical protein
MRELLCLLLLACESPQPLKVPLGDSAATVVESEPAPASAAPILATASAVVRSVRIAPDTLWLNVGDQGKASCLVTGNNGTPLATFCSWRTGDTTIAKATSGTQASTVTAKKAGKTRLFASVKSRADTVLVIVAAKTDTIATNPCGAPGSGPPFVRGLVTDTVTDVLPATLTLTQILPRGTLQASARDECGPIKTNWTWTVRDESVVSTVGATELSSITVTQMANGSSWVVATPDTAPTHPDSSLVSVTGISTTGETVAQADSFVNSISVQLHLLSVGGVYGTQWSAVVRPKLLALGVRHFRERMANGSSSPDPVVVARWQDLASNGIKMTGGCWPTSNTALSSAAHCLTFANLIGTATIDAFDGWNEVDNKAVTSWSSAWVTWETTFFNAKDGDATWTSRPLFANSLAAAGSALSLGDRHTILDFGNMHSYPGGGSVPSVVSNAWIPNWKQVADPKPLVATETGYHNCISNTTCGGVGVDELAQGKYIGRLFFEYFNRGVYRTNWYEFMDEGTGEATRENEWGLIRFSDMGEKPSYVTMKNIIALLTDPGASFNPGTLDYTLSGALSTTHHTLLGKRNGRKYIVLWQELLSYNVSSESDISNATDAVTVNLGFSASAINVYKPRTNGATAVQSGSGTSLAITGGVPDEVLIVEIVP